MDTLKILSVYALIVAFILLILKTCHSCANPEKVAHGTDSVTYWKNKFGDVVASQRSTEEEFAKKEDDYLQAIAFMSNSKPRLIKEYVTVYAESESDVAPVEESRAAEYYAPEDKECPPVIKNLKQQFKNPYYDATVQIGDSSFMKLKTYDTTNVVWKRVKEGSLFRKKNYLQIDVIHANPDVQVAGLKTYRVAEKKPSRYSIGFQAGYGYSVDRQLNLIHRPYVGIGLNKTLIRF